jgi:hypothetical protein
VPGPTSNRWRLFRAIAFAAIATELAALGHLAGGGGTPDAAVLLIGGATIGAISTGLTRARRGWSSIFGVLLACQLAFHLLFSVDMHPMAGGAHSLLPVDEFRMLSFHLLAAAVSALVLARGEAALFGLFAVLRRFGLLGSRAIVVDLPPQWISRSAGPSAPRPSGVLLSASPRRGPPGGR